MKLKIVVVGAGSREFGPATIRDILLSDPVNHQDLEICLMDISPEALEKHTEYAKRIAKKLQRECKVNHTIDINTALEGADYVITAIEIRRYYYWSMDFHIPRKLGFKQIYGENGGPGGLFHALRNFVPTMDIVSKMEKICPGAILLNYTNPLTKLCELIVKSSKINVIGLCHGVLQGKKQLCKLLDIELQELDARASGLNHITWFESIRHQVTGEDLYPELIRKESQANWLAEWDEIALSRILLRNFGKYPSPGTNHIGEYIRWSEEFLGSALLQYFYDPLKTDPWKNGPIPPFVYNLDSHPTSIGLYDDPSSTTHFHTIEQEGEIKDSGELAIPIIEGISCGISTKLAAINIQNTSSYVPGLDQNAVIEVPAEVRDNKLVPTKMQRLPEAILAILRTQCSINQLLVEAYHEKSKNKLLQALLLDPNCHSYRAAVELVNEMCSRQEEVLPELHWQ